MTFNGYLTREQKALLLKTAIESGLIDAPARLRTENINRSFVASIPFTEAPLDKIQMELNYLDVRERLLDGTVPLPIYLDNCASYLRLRALPGADIFSSIATTVGNKASGVSPPPTISPEEDIVTPEAIIGINEMLDFGFLAHGARAGKAVGLIRVPKFQAGIQVIDGVGAPVRFSGTAWLISKSLAITNHHVINARRSDESAALAPDFNLQAEGAMVDFGFDHPGAQEIRADVQGVVAHDVGLDYALLRLQPTELQPLELSNTPLNHTPASWIPVNIIQHPRGGHKRAGIRSNLVSSTTTTEVRYFTDTDSGSSGSPVFDDNWHVVALHRGARQVANIQYQGKTTAFVNFGSQLSAILADVERKAPEVLAEIRAAQEV